MWVRLTREYRGYWKGSILNLPDDEAVDLIATRRAFRAKSTDYMRDFSSPPQDKMMRKSDKQKMKRNHRSQAPTGAHGKQGDDINASY